VQRLKRRYLQLGAGVLSLALVAAACGSSSKNSGGTTGGTTGGNTTGNCSWAPGVQAYGSENNTGTPKKGGTLTALGRSDVDNALDLNIGYLTYDYSMYQLYNRSLYTFPSTHCQQIVPTPDLATALPKVSSDGLHLTVTIRKGAMWDTNPPRQVSAADVILGLKRACNPTDPFGGTGDFSDVLVGYNDFCNGFANVSATSASDQAAYINAHQISGVTVDPNDPLTLHITLSKPASYMSGVMTLPPFNPAPQEILQAVPDSNNVWQYVESDGPYKIQSYDPGKSIVFVRNPSWNASTDPIRKAYVDQINIDETSNNASAFQQVSTNSPTADIMWDTGVPPTNIPGELQSKDPRLGMITSGGPTYLVWNTVSPNNNKALQNPVVRQALNYAIDRSLLIQDAGGPEIEPPATHVLTPPTVGYQPNFDPYPYDQAKAKQMLASAGASNLTLKFLYYTTSAVQSKDVQTLQANLGAIGVHVVPTPVAEKDFYSKYLYKPNQAKSGYWDFAEAGWTPDWFSNGAKTYFVPLFTGTTPTTSNFGLFDDPKLNSMIDSALAAPSDSASAPLWHQADQEVMSQAAWFPIGIQNFTKLQGSQVHNCVISPAWETCSFANVWLSS
jgi:peptide/nickel transport system substrate-binding protein